MNFSIRTESSAAKKLSLAGTQDRDRILAAIDGPVDNPFLGTALKGDLRGLRRLRVGECRARYAVQQDVLVVMVVRVARRRAVYRRRPR